MGLQVFGGRGNFALEVAPPTDMIFCLKARIVPSQSLSNVEVSSMVSGVAELDFIEELRLRRWARENYVPSPKRQDEWHPVIHEEMEKKDREVLEEDRVYYARSRR